MSFIAHREKLGILPFAFYSKSINGATYDDDLRLVIYGFRTRLSKLGDPEPDPGTYGPLKPPVLWESTNNATKPRVWGYGFPSTQQSIAANSNTRAPLDSGARNVFPVSGYDDFRNTTQTTGDRGNDVWGDIETRLARKKANVPFNTIFPNGWPFITQSALNSDEPVDVAVPGFVGLVCGESERLTQGERDSRNGREASGGSGIFTIERNPLGGLGSKISSRGRNFRQDVGLNPDSVSTRVYSARPNDGSIDGDEFAVISSMVDLYVMEDLPRAQNASFGPVMKSSVLGSAAGPQVSPATSKQVPNLGMALRLGLTESSTPGLGAVSGPKTGNAFTGYGFLSGDAGGPIFTSPLGFEIKKEDGRPSKFGPAALSADALFSQSGAGPVGMPGRNGGRFTGPINFMGQNIPSTIQAPLFTTSFIGINPLIEYDDYHGNRQVGMWDVVGTSFFSVVDDEDPPPPESQPPIIGVGPESIFTTGEIARPDGNSGLGVFSARPTQGRALVASVNEIGVPGLVFRSQSWFEGGPDLRNMLGDDFRNDPKAQRAWKSAAAVMRMDAIAQQNGDAQVVTLAKGRGSRYLNGPTASGGVWFMPPEQGMETIDENIPPVQSTSYLGLCGVRQASGTPVLSTGAYKSGFDWGVDENENLTFARRDSSGASTDNMLLITTRGTVQTQAGFEIQGFNDTVSTISDGKVVTVPSGGGVTGLIPNIEVVSSVNDPPFGIVIGDIGAGGSGTILSRGPADVTVAGGPSIGDKVYVDASGDLTVVEPFAGAPHVGIVWEP